MTVGSPYTDSEVRTHLDPTPIAGGQPYLDRLDDGDRLTEADADVTVSTASDLAAEATSDGEKTIWIADGSEIDISGETFVAVDKTIAGNRGQDGADGPLVYSTDCGFDSAAYYNADEFDGGPRGQIELRGECRLTGFRLRGWAHDHFDHEEYPGFIPRKDDYSPDLARGVSCERTSDGERGDHEIDNMEIYGWSTQGVYVGDADNGTVSAEIHHTDLHDNMQTGYGYHVDVKHGDAHVHHCYLNGHRHAIVTFGLSETRYVAEDNVFGPATCDHVLDGHRLDQNVGSCSSDRSDETYGNQIGRNIVIRRNTFCSEEVIDDAAPLRSGHEPTIQFNGVPRPWDGDGAQIVHNRFEQDGPKDNAGRTSSTEPPISQTKTCTDDGFELDSRGFTTNLDVRDNQYNGSESEYDSDYGAPVNLEGDIDADAGSTPEETGSDTDEDGSVPGKMSDLVGWLVDRLGAA